MHILQAIDLPPTVGRLAALLLVLHLSALAGEKPIQEEAQGENTARKKLTEKNCFQNPEHRASFFSVGKNRCV